MTFRPFRKLCWCVVAFIATTLALSPAVYSSDIAPDWLQVPARGTDAAASHAGHLWRIGDDGRAYRFDRDTAQWETVGIRTDLARIDASADGGAAAVARNGAVWVSTGVSGARWRSTGVRARDVGIGGGRLWVADAMLQDGQRAVLVAPFTPRKNFTWTVVAGRVERIDADAAGRGWAVDTNGGVYVYADGRWIRDGNAPAAADLGVGGLGSVYAVGRQQTQELGGGRVVWRDPATGAWTALKGRLSAVSADAEDRPFGVNALGWVLAGAGVTSAVAPPAEEPPTDTAPADGTTLAAFAGDAISLPATLGSALVQDVEARGEVRSARLRLNGIDAVALSYVPRGAAVPNLVLSHRRLAITDYVPDLAGTAAEAIGSLDRPAFLFVASGNAGREPTPADRAALAELTGRAAFARVAPTTEGIHLFATTDLVAAGIDPAMPAVLGLADGRVALSTPVAPSLFSNVRPGDQVPDPLTGLAPAARSFDELDRIYGRAFFEDIALSAPAARLVGRTVGPATIRRAQWRLRLVRPEFGPLTDLALEAGLTTTLELPVKTLDETFTASDVVMRYDAPNRRFSLSGDVERARAEQLVNVRGFEFDSVTFAGTLTHAKDWSLDAGAAGIASFKLTVEGAGRLPSRHPERETVPVEIAVTLEPDAAGPALIPTVLVATALRLSDIAGDVVPAEVDPALTQVKVSRDFQSGQVTLHGSPVDVVRYQGPDDPAALIALRHQSLDLGHYVPAIRGTSLGSFGLANATLLVRPESARGALEYATVDDLPEPLRAFLAELTTPGVFPLSLPPGVNVVGTFAPPADDGNGQALLTAYGIAPDGYTVKGNFRLSQLRNPQFGTPRPDARAICRAAASADPSGLDLAFPISGFKPPYADDAVTFADSRFTLRETGGQIEPAIVTGMTFDLPDSAAGLRQVAMAAKLSVQGSLNVLCDGVTASDDVRVAYAGSTALDLEQVEERAFEALARVTPGALPALAAGATAAAPDLGWRNAFGVPFLTVRQFATAGEFTQADGVRKMTGRTWAASVVGQAPIDAYGEMTSTLKPDGLTLDSFSFRLPGPVAITALPGLERFPGAGGMTLADIELSNTGMFGELRWDRNRDGQVVTGAGSPDVKAAAWLGLYELPGSAEARHRFELFFGLSQFAPGMLWNRGQLPDVIADQAIGPVVLGFSDRERRPVSVRGMPEKQRQLVVSTVPELDDTTLSVARGLTVAGRWSPAQVAEPSTRDFLVRDLGLAGPLLIRGDFGTDGDGDVHGELAVEVPALSLPVTLLGSKPTAGDAFFVVSSYDGGYYYLQSDGNVTVGRETIEFSALAEWQRPDNGGAVELSDWRFVAPGPVRIGGLPGLGDMPKVSEFILSEVTLSATDMRGTLGWDRNGDGVITSGSPDTSGTAWYTSTGGIDPDVALWLRVERLQPDMLLGDLAGPLGSRALAPAVIGWRSRSDGELAVGQHDALFGRGFEGLLGPDDRFEAKRGLTFAGRTRVPELEAALRASVERAPADAFLLDALRITDDALMLTGAYTVDAAGRLTGDLSATLAAFEVRDIPGTVATFRRGRLSLGTGRDANRAAIAAQARISPPGANGFFEMRGEVGVSRANLTDAFVLSVSASSDEVWEEPLAIPDLVLSDLAMAARVEQASGKQNLALSLCGDVRFEGRSFIAGRDVTGCVEVDTATGRVSVDASPADSVVSMEFDPPVVLSDVLDAGGGLLAGIGSRAAGQSTATVPPAWPDVVADGSVRKLYLSRSAFAFDGSVSLGDARLDGFVVAIDDGGQRAFMVRKNTSTRLVDLIPERNTPLPLRGFSVPEGVFVLSTRAAKDYSLEGIPAVLFKRLYKGLIDEQTGARLAVADGVTLLTRMNASAFPPPIAAVLSGPFGLGDNLLIGGAVGGLFGGPPAVAFFTELEGVTPSLPGALEQFFAFKDGDVRVFVRGAEGAGGSEVEVGVESEAWLKARRLDTGAIQTVRLPDGTVTPGLPSVFGLTYSVGPDGTSFEIGARVQGQWDDPFGIEGFSLTDPDVAVGVAGGAGGSGTTLALHVDRARYTAGGETVEFVLDLDTAWAGAAPTSLSVQLARAPEAPELVLRPVLLARLQKSLFDVVFASGSNLLGAVVDRSYLNLAGPLRQFSRTLSGASDGMFTLVERSPLALIGVRDPYLYFGTPGSTPPYRQGVDRPPFGLGLQVEGELVLMAGDLEAEVADGEYRVNLKDGYFVRGTLLPPAPFERSQFAVTGTQSLLTGVPGALRLEGNLSLPVDLLPGIPAEVSGYFDFSRPGLVSRDANVAAGISVAGGRVERTASLSVSGRRVAVSSSPLGCVDVPVKLDANVTINAPADVLQLMTAARPDLPVPDPLACPEALIKLWTDALELAEDVARDPTRLAADPLAAQKAMMNAGRMVLGQLPDNPVTRELYAGMDLADGVVGDGAALVGEVLETVPGAGVVGAGVAEARALAQQATAEAAARVGEAAAAAGQLAGETARATVDAMEQGPALAAETLAAALESPGQALSGALNGIRDFANQLGRKRNYCNVRIEQVRLRRLEPTQVMADEMWQAIEPVWLAGKRAESILAGVPDMYSRHIAALDPDALLMLAKDWNDFAYRLEQPELYIEYVSEYHKYGAGWQPGRALDEQETWYFQFPEQRDMTALVRRYLLRRDKQNRDTEFFLKFLKRWATISNFDPAADYPGFRCEKVFALQNVLATAENMGFPIRTYNTDHLLNEEYYGALNSIRASAARIDSVSDAAVAGLRRFQVKTVERNVAFVSDLYLKMFSVLNATKALGRADERLVRRAERILERFFSRAMAMAQLNVDGAHARTLRQDLTRVIARFDAMLVSDFTAELDRLNRDWSDTTVMPTIVLPYVDRCLRSFYRRADNRNPLFVSECHPELQAVLADLDNGIARSPATATRVLQRVSINAVTGERYVRQNRTYQFRLFDAERDATVRVSTAVSETAPESDYCLAVPVSFSPSLEASAVRALPCVAEDANQLWTKVPDSGGDAFFRLKSPERGLCATWSGVDGVDALVLDECSEANRARQVMTAGWPLRNAAGEPRLRPAETERRYVWRNFANARCLRANSQSGRGLFASAMSDLPHLACGRATPDARVDAGIKFDVVAVGPDTRRFVSGRGANRQCLVATDTYFHYFGDAADGPGPNQFRTVQLGACDGPGSLWVLGPPGWDGFHEDNYSIREASGQGHCMRVLEGSSNAGRVSLPIGLTPCRLVPLSDKRPDIFVRPTSQLFYPIAVR